MHHIEESRQQSDVDLERGTLIVARSHLREQTKGGDAAVLPIPAPLWPWIRYQLNRAPGPLLFPAPDGSQRPREADPQKILRHALGRAGIVEGYEHCCRWCGYKTDAPDGEPRYCPTCVKRTDGRGNPLVPLRGKKPWARRVHVKMRFHDLRHTFATALLRSGAAQARSRDAVGNSAPPEPHEAPDRVSVETYASAEAAENPTALGWWALQDSNLRPLPCESAQGSRQTYTSLIKSSQSLEITKRSSSDLRPALAPFFPQLGPNWVQCLSSKHCPARGSRGALLSVRQVAQFLGVSTAIVYRICERRDLVHVRIGNTIRIALTDLVGFVDRQKQRR